MQRIECELPKSCEFVFWGDSHGGSQLTHYEGIGEIIEYIGTHRYCYWEHGGDWIEAIMSDDKRFNDDLYANKDEKGKPKPTSIPLKQANQMINMVRPIRKKGRAGLGGNHELKLHRFGNLSEYICGELGIPYGTKTARLIFNNNNKRMFNVFVTHDVPIFRSQAKDFIQGQANMLAAMKQSLYKRMGDCAAMICHHAHQLMIIPPNPELYLVDGKTGVKQHYLQGDMGVEGQYIDHNRRWYGCAGSTRKRFVDGIDDYSDIYAPNELGCLIMTIHNGVIENIRKFTV